MKKLSFILGFICLFSTINTFGQAKPKTKEKKETKEVKSTKTEKKEVEKKEEKKEAKEKIVKEFTGRQLAHLH